MKNLMKNDTAVAIGVGVISFLAVAFMYYRKSKKTTSSFVGGDYFEPSSRFVGDDYFEPTLR